MNEVCSCPLQTSNFQNPYDIPFYWWVHEELSIIPVQLDCTIPYIQQMIRGFGQCSNSFQEVHFLTKYKSTVSTKTIRVSDETPGILKGDKKRNLLVNFTIASRDELQRILDRYVKQPGKKKTGLLKLSPFTPWPLAKKKLNTPSHVPSVASAPSAPPRYARRPTWLLFRASARSGRGHPWGQWP